MPASIRLRPGTYQRREFTAKETHCPLCQGKLRISQHAAHVFWTLNGRLGTISKEKRCLSKECPHPKLRFRPPEPRLLAISHSNLGMDLVFFVGEKRLSEGRTFRSLWEDLKKRGIDVTQRTLQNAFHYYMSLFDTERLEKPETRDKMRANQGMVLAMDKVQFDPKGPVLLVLLEVLTSEVIYVEKTNNAQQKTLESFFRRGLHLIEEIDLPIFSASFGDGVELGESFQRLWETTYPLVAGVEGRPSSRRKARHRRKPAMQLA